MSCYDWGRTLAHRFDPHSPPPSDWSAAREHLSRCESCRREATRIDPTLAFRGAAAWSPGADESESMRLAVRALRRTGRLRGEVAASGGAERHRGRRGLAVVAFFAAALAFVPAAVDHSVVDSVEFAAADALGGLGGSAPLSSVVAPAIDGLDRPLARVYEWGAEDLSVVMVVDESLDV